MSDLNLLLEKIVEEHSASGIHVFEFPDGGNLFRTIDPKTGFQEMKFAVWVYRRGDPKHLPELFHGKPLGRARVESLGYGWAIACVEIEVAEGLDAKQNLLAYFQGKVREAIERIYLL